MLHLFRTTVNPRLSLERCLTNWFEISKRLREPPRKRSFQTENWGKTL